MGIDLTHPDELDWMARGRRGELRAALFTNRASDEQLERETENELLKQLLRRLVERGVCDEPDDDPHDVDRIVTYAERMVDEVGPEHREAIERDVWCELDANSNVEGFGARFRERVADRIIDVCLEREGMPGHDDVVAE